jgi:Protein of unknown function (DUF2637)
VATTSDQNRGSGGTLRTMAVIAVALGLAALTAAACALSYRSMHALAREAGVSAPLAAIYPLVFDAMLAIAGCAVLGLRGAGLISRIYGWFCFLVLLAALAAGGTLRAAGTHLPRRPAEIAAAIIPFALVLLSFGLLLALLRHARRRRLAQSSAGTRTAGEPAADSGASARPGASSGVIVLPADDIPAGMQDTAAIPVPQADLQLRATSARQPSVQLAERPVPFMPPVGPKGDLKLQKGPGKRTSRRRAAIDPGLPGELSAAGGETGEAGFGASAANSDPIPDPAPVQDSGQGTAEPASPPAFERPHSSPTPPEG